MSSPEDHAPGAWTARLNFDPTAFVAPGAIVTGEVTLGARSSVWFNTVIRASPFIGAILITSLELPIFDSLWLRM